MAPFLLGVRKSANTLAERFINSGIEVRASG